MVFPDVSVSWMPVHTCVDKVVGIIVVSDRAGLRFVELRVFDFFELHHCRLLIASGCG